MLTKAVYRLNVVPIKFPTQFFTGLEFSFLLPHLPQCEQAASYFCHHSPQLLLLPPPLQLIADQTTNPLAKQTLCALVCQVFHHSLRKLTNVENYPESTHKTTEKKIPL